MVRGSLFCALSIWIEFETRSQVPRLNFVAYIFVLKNNRKHRLSLIQFGVGQQFSTKSELKLKIADSMLNKI
jgi:hypothetical protein